MSTLVGQRAPVMFAVSGSEAIPGLQDRVNLTRETTGIVVVTCRPLGRAAPVTVGPHIMSPPWLSTASLEERLGELLRERHIELSSSQRVPGTLPLPPGLTGNAAPIAVLTLDLVLGLESLGTIGRLLRPLRAEGIVIVGIAYDEPATHGGAAMIGTVAVLLGAAFEDDCLSHLGRRPGGLGFILLPELHDAAPDDHSFFHIAEAAGEMPHAVFEQLRPFVTAEESEGSGTGLASRSEADV